MDDTYSGAPSGEPRETVCDKDEFLAMLAHELRNPLAPMRNAVEILRRMNVPDPRLDWVGAVLDRQISQLARLVDDLLDVSRVTHGQIQLHLEPVEIAAMIDAAVEISEPLIRDRQHDLIVRLPDEPVWVYGDRVRLVQILDNLLNNAAKYTDDHGRIEISVDPGETDVRVRVRDDGIGMMAEFVPHVFDLFSQATRPLDRAPGGLGVGLTLVKRLVELHGGWIEARSEGLGRGAEFLVHLLRWPLPTPDASRFPDAADAIGTAEPKGQAVPAPTG